MTVAAAQAEATSLVGPAWAQYPPEVQRAFENAPIGWVVTPYRDTVSGQSRPLVLVLFGTVLLLLLAGCTNLGSLLLAPTTGRQRELAVRASLGAGRVRLVRQLLVESLLLAVLGALLGLAAAWALVQVAPLLLPATMPRIDQTPGYLEALGVPVREGRGLRDGDGANGDTPVLVNETAARMFWPGDSAVGKRLRSALDGSWLNVVGVVGDVRESGLDSDASAHVYGPLAGVENDSLGENVVGMFRHPHLVVSTAAPPEGVGGLLRPALAGIGPRPALTPPVLMREAVVQSVSKQRLAAVVVGLFSVAALAIAAAGLHGILTFGVAQRRREFGIRLALGATPAGVVRLVARDGLLLAGRGLALGLAGASAAAGLVRGMLVGVSPADPLTFSAVAVVVLGVAAVATWRPAFAATRIDPAATIREA